MDLQSVNDLGDFHKFVGKKLHKGETWLSPEQALDEWRVLHPDPVATREDNAAIQEALDDMQRGDVGTAWEDFDRDFRARRNLPTAS